MAIDPVCKMVVEEALRQQLLPSTRERDTTSALLVARRLSTRTLRNTSPRGRIKFTGREKLANSAYHQEKFRKVV